MGFNIKHGYFFYHYIFILLKRGIGAFFLTRYAAHLYHVLHSYPNTVQISYPWDAGCKKLRMNRKNLN